MTEDRRNDERGAGFDRGDADRGATFIELLVSIVLIGLVVVAVLTALNVTIRGSDQHKSKIMALAELEGSAAHLNRVFANDSAADCPSAVASTFDTELANAYAPGGPLDDPNRGVTVSATNVICVNDVALVTLVASHAKGNATEQLDVTVGGITVLENGDLGAAGACTWGTPTVTPDNPEVKPSGRLNSSVVVSLSYTGDCRTELVDLVVTSPAAYVPTIEAMAQVGDEFSGEKVFTFSKNYYSPWIDGPVLLDLVTSTATFPASFTVLP